MKSSGCPQRVHDDPLKGAQRVVVRLDVSDLVAHSLHVHHHAIIRPNPGGWIESAQESVQHRVPVISHPPPIRVVHVKELRDRQGVHVRPRLTGREYAKVASTAVWMKRCVGVNGSSGYPVTYGPGAPKVRR